MTMNDHSSASNANSSDPMPSYNLFIGGLEQNTTEETVQKYFQKFGKITDVNLMIDWVTNKSKRCAIVFCAN